MISLIKGWIFNKNEAKIASIVRDILWFDKLLLESNEEKFSFEESRVKR